MGRLFGFLDEHTSLVENFRIFSTGYISPHFHLFFDDLFETDIFSKYDENVFKDIFNNLFELNRD